MKNIIKKKLLCTVSYCVLLSGSVMASTPNQPRDLPSTAPSSQATDARGDDENQQQYTSLSDKELQARRKELAVQINHLGMQEPFNPIGYENQIQGYKNSLRLNQAKLQEQKKNNADKSLIDTTQESVTYYSDKLEAAETELKLLKEGHEHIKATLAALRIDIDGVKEEQRRRLEERRMANRKINP